MSADNLLYCNGFYNRFLSGFLMHYMQPILSAFSLTEIISIKILQFFCFKKYKKRNPLPLNHVDKRYLI